MEKEKLEIPNVRKKEKRKKTRMVERGKRLSVIPRLYNTV
jgi:hypothetical protein